MTGAFTWTGPTPVERGEPTSPYAHWWLEKHADLELASLGRTDAAGMLRVGPSGTDGLAGRVEGLATEGKTTKGRRIALPEKSTGWPEFLPREYDCLVATKLPPDVVNSKPGERDWLSEDLGKVPADHVIVAVIDDGIGFANERFRKWPGRTETRVDYIWLQGAPRSGAASDLGFGRELGRTEIDALLARRAKDPAFDDAAIYRELGLIDYRRSEVQSAGWRASHGTGVLDLAAGYREGDEAADQVTIMGVSLPSQITQDTSGTFLEFFVMLAIQRILDRVAWHAAANGASYHVVINISYSLTAGAKDGTAPIDRYIDHLTASPPRGVQSVAFVVPAGNHRLSMTHGRLELGTSDTSGWLKWRVLPDDRTPSFVEIWAQGPNSGKAAVVVEVVPPGGDPDLPLRVPDHIRFGSYVELKSGDKADGRCFARAYYSWQDKVATGKDAPRCQRIVLVVPPTVADVPEQEIGPAGDWQVRLRRLDGAPAQSVDLFVQRDDTPAGYRQRGRQSYFVDERYREYDAAGRLVESDPREDEAAVKREGTVNAFATSRHVKVVGGFRWLGEKQMPYSGTGGTPARPTPDVLAPTDESLVHRGMPVAGTLSGSSALLSGTSVAAPWAARGKAEDLLRGKRTIAPVPPRIGGIAVVLPSTDRDGPRIHRPPAISSETRASARALGGLASVPKAWMSATEQMGSNFRRSLTRMVQRALAMMARATATSRMS